MPAPGPVVAIIVDTAGVEPEQEDSVFDGTRRSCPVECFSASGHFDSIVYVSARTPAEALRAAAPEIPPTAEIAVLHELPRPEFRPTKTPDRAETAEISTEIRQLDEQAAPQITALRAGAPIAVVTAPVTETVKLVGADGIILTTVDRNSLLHVRTPQSYRLDVFSTLFTNPPPANLFADLPLLAATAAGIAPQTIQTFQP